MRHAVGRQWRIVTRSASHPHNGTRRNHKTLRQLNNLGWRSSRRSLSERCGSHLPSQRPDRFRSQRASTYQHAEPTIYALSTAPGRAAIAIIRISGAACLDVYRSLCPGKQDPRPRHATLRTLYEPYQGESLAAVLDSNALVLYFPAPRTVTGEDVLELHLHGGPAVIKAVLAAIAKCCSKTSRLRYAEPGEFTRRAFLNNRLDLTQVEALGDILSATTEQQRRLSVRGTANGLAKHYEEWRKQLLYARGELEALIDFSEDQHFDESPQELCASVAEQVRGLRRILRTHRQNAMKGEMLRNGISLSLLGAPNAGKSSLLNRIVGREAAIVSREAGTTRDIVEVGLDLGGYFCRLGDTAGLRTAKADVQIESTSQEVIGQIEQEGMRRAKDRALHSDVVIVVLSFEQTQDREPQLQLDTEVTSTAAELVKTKNNVLIVINKTDLSASSTALQTAVSETIRALPGIDRERIHLISCKQASTTSSSEDPGNIQLFLHSLIAHFATLTTALSTPTSTSTSTTNPNPNSDKNDPPDPSIWQDSLGATERHRLLLDACIASLEAFLVEVDPPAEEEEDHDPDIVVAAEHLRSAAVSLARITGRGEGGDVEEVLGVVFEKFCVGK